MAREMDDIIDNGHADPFIEELSRFRESGHHIDTEDRVGHTWLTRAIVSGHMKPYTGCVETRIQAVIAAGANPNVAGSDVTPLLYACGWQYGYGAGPNSRAVQMLLAAGANPLAPLSIKLPKTVIANNDIDFSEDEFVEMHTLEEWLADLESQNDLMAKYHPEFFGAVKHTEKEIAAIRALLKQ